MNDTVEARAVKIAAKIMVAAGICRYDCTDKCRHMGFVDEITCDRCIRNWLLTKAKKELKQEAAHE
ncbi:MAG: hypothetical protein GXW99_05335 [Clostridiales bacterium]|nr:hypothetical protein [Clostridiales bacterium]